MEVRMSTVHGVLARRHADPTVFYELQIAEPERFDPDTDIGCPRADSRSGARGPLPLCPESLDQTRHSNLELGIFDQATAAHAKNARRLDRHRSRVLLVDRAIAARTDRGLRIDFEGAQMNFFRRLSVRRKEAGPQNTPLARTGCEAGLLEELPSGPDGH